MANARRVVITGATGQIGRKLCAKLEAKGYRVVVFSRDPDRARRSLRNASEFVAWTPSEDGPWAAAIDGAYAVIHLAGANLFGRRWNDAYKKEIYDSRVVGTRGIVNAIGAARNKPSVFISGSAIGIYGAHGDEPLDESTPPGNDFLAKVCADWEKEGQRAEQFGVRTVIVRTGVVLNPAKGALPINLRGISPSRPGLILDTDSGALPLMSMPFKLFAGGPIGSGKQWFSWIHLDDEIGLILMALEDERVRGPINATAPEPQTQRDFSKVLGKVMKSPSWMPVPGFALKLMLGQMADAMLIEGQRVIPSKAQELGYKFKYTESEPALRNLLKK